jgi:hypothetical protein
MPDACKARLPVRVQKWKCPGSRGTPFYPQEQTSSGYPSMSVWCQLRTHATQQTAHHDPPPITPGRDPVSIFSGRLRASPEQGVVTTFWIFGRQPARAKLGGRSSLTSGTSLRWSNYRRRPPPPPVSIGADPQLSDLRARRNSSIGSVVAASVVALHKPIVASDRNVCLLETTISLAKDCLLITVQ